MSRSSLRDAVPPGHRLLLDTSALIAYLSGDEPVAPMARIVIDEFVGSGRNVAIISMVTVMGILVRPMRVGAVPVAHALNFLERFPNFELHPVDARVAHEAARLRAFYAFKPPDALVIATGTVAQTQCLVTNDRKWLRLVQTDVPQVEVCYLGQYNDPQGA